MSPYVTINSPMVKLYETGNPAPTKTEKQHMNWCVHYALLFYRNVSHLMIHVISQSLSCPIMFNYYQWYTKYYQLIISVYLSQLSLFSHIKSYELCKIFNISLYSHSDILTIQWYIDYHWYSNGLIANISLYVTDILTYIANNHRHFPQFWSAFSSKRRCSSPWLFLAESFSSARMAGLVPPCFKGDISKELKS